jgi:hypothetical protein
VLPLGPRHGKPPERLRDALGGRRIEGLGFAAAEPLLREVAGENAAVVPRDQARVSDSPPGREPLGQCALNPGAVFRGATCHGLRECDAQVREQVGRDELGLLAEIAFDHLGLELHQQVER